MSRPQSSPAPALTACALILGAAPPALGGSAAAVERTADAAPPYQEVAADSGLRFTHFNGMTGKFYYPEVMAGGVALLDYDGDGDLDVFFAQGRLLGAGETMADALLPPAPGTPPGDRLFRNDLEVTADGSRRLRFTDVSAAGGLGAADWHAGTYGIGVAAGDYDNDGRTDLYVTGYGANRLLHNRGDGSFEDLTAKAGADDPAWSSSAAFADYDGDGWLDLYVVDYVDFRVAENPACYAATSRRDWCGPGDFPPVADRLLHNRGDGTFEDVSRRSGIADHPAPGLGVVAADFDGDGRTDFYVANDGAPNQLWLARAEDGFEDAALLAGVAVNRQGRPEAGMGIAAGDADGDGDLDLLVTHLTAETDTLYLAEGDGLFADRTDLVGLAASSLPYTAFGTAWLDYDADGDLDLAIACGDVRTIPELAEAGEPLPFGQPDRLLRNLGNGGRGGPRFAEMDGWGGAAGGLLEAGRGLAAGDLDEDGDPDLVIANDAGPARLYLDRAADGHPWLGVRPVEPSGRDALGATLELLRGGRAVAVRRAASDGSYASAGDPRVVFAPAGDATPAAVRVRWPDGTVETWPDLELGRYHTLRRGAAPPAAAGAPSAAGVASGGDPER